MFNNKKVLAVVPSRAGSKRLPHKNILELSGKPLIAWSIEAGLESEYIDQVVVSTEDETIANIAKEYGAEVPFLRPVELASDKARTIDVLTYTVNKLHEAGDIYDYLVLLQPTSPLRTAIHINEAFDVLSNPKATGVISVCSVNHPVEWTNILPEDGCMDDFNKSIDINKRSQDYSKRYQLNGAIYIVDIKKLLSEKTLFLKAGIYSYIMGYRESIDVDTIDDFHVAEYFFKNINN